LFKKQPICSGDRHSLTAGVPLGQVRKPEERARLAITRGCPYAFLYRRMP